MSLNEIDFEIQQFIDNRFGSDFKKLSQIESIYNEVLQHQEDLEDQMKIVEDFDEINSEDQNSFKESIFSILQQLKRAENVQSRKDEIIEKFDELLEEYSKGSEQFVAHHKNIEKLQRYILYMKYVDKINENSESIQQAILSDSMLDACCIFKRLVTYHGCLIDQSSKCENVTTFLHQTILYWYKILKSKLSEQFEELLKSNGWPYLHQKGPNCLVSTETAVDTKSPPTTPLSPQNQHLSSPGIKLDLVIRNLLNIQLPKHVRSSKSSSQDQGDQKIDEDEEDSVILLPFRIMLRPLRKRFEYHFIGKKETNILEKPDWYFAQISSWIENHSSFLEDTIQPILDKHKHQYVDALVMFSQGLLQLASRKLAFDMDDILESYSIFLNVVNEVLFFDRDLRNTHNLPASFLSLHSPINVLTLPKCIDKWLQIEKVWVQEKLENLLSSPSSWNPKFVGDSYLDEDIDESKIPECAESFINLLYTITDRYKNLPRWEDKVRFLNFQLDTLDDFRLRITQIVRSIKSSDDNHEVFAILNTSQYISSVLAEWTDNLFFIELNYHREKLLKIENKSAEYKSETSFGDKTVFSDLIELYEKIYCDGLDGLVDEISTQLKTKSYHYITESWFSLPPPSDQVAMIVSRSACPFFALLQERLVFMENKLTSIIFTKFWRQLAEEIDLFIFHEVIVKNKFNYGGAAQLKFDIHENLFPLFRSFTTKPEAYFKRIKEACVVLNLQFGEALLVREQILDEDKKIGEQVLKDIGIIFTKPEHVLTLFTRRTDWNDE